MTRSLFNPSDIDTSIRRLSSSKGKTFRYFLRYMEAPAELQKLLPSPTQTFYLRNIRSDLSTWRSALSQVPPNRLLDIPWIRFLTLSRDDLLDRTENFCISRIMEDLRLFTTKLTPDGLYIGSVVSLNSYSIPAFINPNKGVPKPQPTPITDPNAEPDYYSTYNSTPARPGDQIHLLEAELSTLEREKKKLELRAHSRYSPDPKAATQLIEVENRILEIHKELDQLQD